MQGGCLIVTVQPGLFIPKKLVGIDLDASSNLIPFGGRGGVIQLLGQVLSILKHKLENGICLDVLDVDKLCR